MLQLLCVEDNSKSTHTVAGSLSDVDGEALCHLNVNGAHQRVPIDDVWLLQNEETISLEKLSADVKTLDFDLFVFCAVNSFQEVGPEGRDNSRSSRVLVLSRSAVVNALIDDSLDAKRENIDGLLFAVHNLGG